MYKQGHQVLTIARILEQKLDHKSVQGMGIVKGQAIHNLVKCSVPNNDGKIP